MPGRTADLWWKNAIVYCLDVETFQDSNGDGIGDLVGLTRRLDHLAGLGVSCLWLMPFIPSPNR
ncbi:MAG: alpha-amylase family glycosyl hydrolase, partial [Geminicoccales bacterium]